MTWNPLDLPDQTGRTHVVTGATAGIGYFAAEQLAGAGARLVLAARSPQRLETAAASIREQVPGAEVQGVVVDLTSRDSVARAAHELGYHVGLVTDAVTDLSADAHENSIERIFPRLGERTTTAAVLAMLDPA